MVFSGQIPIVSRHSIVKPVADNRQPGKRLRRAGASRF